MTDENALKKRIKAQSEIKDVDAVLAAALPAVREGTSSGEWFAIKCPRLDDQVNNRVTNLELNANLAANFGDKGAEGGESPTYAAQALARAILAEIAGGDDRTATLGGDDYEVQFATPKRGGRTQLRLRNPNASAGDGESDDAEATGE